MQLEKLRMRDHLVVGLLSALGRVDAIVRVVKDSVDTAAAREVFTSAAFGFSSEQVCTILTMLTIVLLGSATGGGDSRSYSSALDSP